MRSVVTTKRNGIGVIGCGKISDIYLKNLTGARSVEVLGVTDMVAERAEEKAAAYGVPALSLDALLESEDIGYVVNLTVPAAHVEVSEAALNHGKHVYSEKPFSLGKDEGTRLWELARGKGLRACSAPDTVLGGGIQTARKLIDDGWIGEPVAGTAFMMGHGPENWHPNPHFFYQPGAGPLFDMGPYYLTTLVHLLGPVADVAAMTRASFAERVIRNPSRNGERIPVNTPTHVAGTLAFEAGPLVTMVQSFDVWSSTLPRIEIYGSEGSMVVPDPNTFGGTIMVRHHDASEWQSMAPLFRPVENSRGIGVLDLVEAVEAGRTPRCDGSIGLHIVEVMEAMLQSGDTGRRITIETRPERPEPMPLSLR